MKQVLFFTFLSLFFTNCFDAPESIDEEEIHGNWVGLSYLEGETLRDDASSYGFKFLEDSTYVGLYDSKQVEEGVYRIESNKLYTTAKGLAEKNVELQYISQDSMIMKMNRSGIIEVLTLGRVSE